MTDRTIRVTLVGDASSLIAAANESRQALNGLANVNIGNVRTSIRSASQAAQEGAGAFGKWSNALKTGLAVMGLQAGFQGITQGFKSVVVAGLDYQGSLNTLQAVTGASADMMGKLQAKAIELGKDVTLPGASAATAAEAMKELAKGGLEASDVLDSVYGSLTLATAAHISGAEAAQAQAKTLNAFGLEAQRAGDISDYLANAANAATGEITDMMQAMQQAATVAKGVGATVEETATTLALFAKNGVIGSDAGTSFKTMITQLASPTREQTFALRDLGVNMFDLQGNFLGMQALTGQLQAAYGRLSTAQYNQAAATAFGTDALRGANILGAEGVEGFKQMSRAVTLQGGAAELAEAQNQGLNGAFGRLSNTVETMTGELFMKMQPALIAVADGFVWLGDKIGWVGDRFAWLWTPLQGFLLGMGAVVLLRVPIAALSNAIGLLIGRAVLGLNGLYVAAIRAGGGLSFLSLGFKALGATIKAFFLTNPLGWLILLVSTVLPMFMSSTEDAGGVVEDLTEVVDKNTGALKANAQMALAANEKFKPLYARYMDLKGAQQGDFTNASLGDPDAIARVQAVLQGTAKAAIEANGDLANYQERTGDLTMTSDKLAEAVLGGTESVVGMSAAMHDAYALNADFINQKDRVNAAMNDGIAAGLESGAAQRTNNTLTKDQISLSKDVDAAINGVLKAMEGQTHAATVFAAAMRPIKAVTDAASGAFDYLKTTMATGGMKSVPQWVAESARENDAAYRKVGASARDYEAAVAGVGAAEKELSDTRNGSASELEAIARAQESVASAQDSVGEAEKSYSKTVESNQRSITDAEKSLTKAREDSAKTAADDQKALQKAREDSIKSQQDAEKELRDAREKQATDDKDAQKALVKARQDAAEKMSEAQDKVAKAQADAIKSVQKETENLAKVQVKAAEDMADAQDKLNKAMRESNKSAVELRVAQEAVIAARAKAADETIGAGGSAETAAFNTFAAAQDKLIALQRSGKASAYELAKAQDAVNKATANPNLAKELASAMNDLTKAEKDNADNQDKTKDAKKDFSRTKKDTGEKIKNAKEGLQDAKDKGKENIDGAKKDQAKAAIDAAESIANAQRKVVETAKAGAEEVAKAQLKITEAMRAGAESIAAAQLKISDDAKSSAESIAKAQQQVSDSYANAADAVTAAQKSVDDANRSVADAQAAVTQAQADAVPTAEEIAEAERKLADAKDGVSDASDAQAAATEAAADQALKASAQTWALYAANGDLKGAAEAAGQTMAIQREEFIKSKMESGLTRDAAEKLADQYNLIPGDVKTKFSNIDGDYAKLLAEELNKALDNVDGKHVTFTASGDIVVADNFNQGITDMFNQIRGTFNKSFGFDMFSPLTPPNQTPIVRGKALPRADGGFVSGPGGSKDDKIHARLSNGEFVMNAGQTKKYRGLLEDMNSGTNGFAAGGYVGMLGYAAGGQVKGKNAPVAVSAPSGDAWGGIAGNVKDAWDAIDPVMKGMDQAAADTGKAQQDLLDTAVAPAWAGITKAVTDAREQVGAEHDQINSGTVEVGKTLADTQSNVITPTWQAVSGTVRNAWDANISQTYARLNAGTTDVGAHLDSTRTQRINPSWDAIGGKVAATWRDSLSPQYGNINAGTTGVGTAMGNTKNAMDGHWTAIARNIKSGYDNSIRPAYDKVTAHTKAVSGFFGGISKGTKDASKSTAADLITINTEIDGFFAKINKLAPAAPPAQGGTGAAPRTPAGSTQALADGGIITAGTGPRADDVHIRASKGEYVVNAASTAKHRGELDRINFGGAFADGGYITGKAGDTIAKGVSGAIVSGTQRAIGAAVDRLVAANQPASTDGGSGEYLPATGARGKFLDAILSKRGTEYVWGAAGPDVFDCSGLMSWGLEQAGVGKGRLTAADFNHSFPHITVAKPGDMVTFDTGRIPGDAGHIGAVVDPSKGLMMHTDGAGPARVSDYKSRDGGPLSIIDPIGGTYVPKVTTPPPGTGSKPGDPPSAGWLADVMKRLKSMVSTQGGATRLQNTVDPMIDHGAMNMAHGTMANVGPIPPGPALERWRPLYQSAIEKLGMTGTVSLDNMMYQMFRESSGDPLAIEETDSNFRAGHPSKGLLQTIPSTFRAYAEPGYSTNIWDPLSNAFASLNYVKANYGGKYPGGAYDKGGMLQPGLSTNYNGTGVPEPVLTDSQWALANSAMTYVINNSMSSAPPTVTLNARVFVGGKELMDDVRIEVDNSYVQLRTEINRQRRQEI